jgi:methyltransferase (TIGR00027 family)
MDDEQTAVADSSAVRVALWRAMHARVDPPPHVFSDEIGLRLAAPDAGWRNRPDMDEHATSRARAAMAARARFVEDLVVEQAGHGVGQFVILGAGLDTFAQRRPDVAAGLRVYEVDQPGPQAWKRRRLIELGYGIPPWLRLVPVDFEAGWSWWERLATAGFDASRPAVVASAGVSMYLTRDAIAATLAHAATLAEGSTLVMTFMVPLELVEPAERPLRQASEKFAEASGTPFLSFFTPQQMMTLSREAGFGKAEHVSAATLTHRYFADRPDNLRPSSMEELLLAST